MRARKSSAQHTGERAAILKLHFYNFYEFDEKELLRAEFLWRDVPEQ